MRVAVIGSGIAGLSAAHALDKAANTDVVLFEAADRLGGHANTVTVTDPTAGELGVDTGFIVHNDRNYPALVALFEELNVEVQDTEMSFAVTDRATGFHYRATNINTLFADRSNLIRPTMWRMLADIVRFYRNANRFLDGADPSAPPGQSIAEFLRDGRYHTSFVDLHLVPMGAAVWSTDPTTFDQFPAYSLLSFLRNHGLLGVGDRPQWRTVVGGSRAYVNAFEAAFGGEVRRNAAVASVSRTTAEEFVTVTANGNSEHFDEVVLACHSDQALAMLSDATPAEKDVLGAIRYQPNRATLHTDISLLPPTESAWAAWNYECAVGSDDAAAVTYDLTCLQRLPGARRYLVTLNSEERIDPAQVLGSFDYSHPVFDQPAIAAQQRHGEISGVANTHFCGAYWGFGFHEDGMASGLRVAAALGADVKALS